MAQLSAPDNNSKSMFHYQIDPLIKPESNLAVWAWLALLGIPALLLMMIYSKSEDLASTGQEKAPVQMEKPAQHLHLQKHP